MIENRLKKGLRIQVLLQHLRKQIQSNQEIRLDNLLSMLQVPYPSLFEIPRYASLGILLYDHI